MDPVAEKQEHEQRHNSWLNSLGGDGWVLKDDIPEDAIPTDRCICGYIWPEKRDKMQIIRQGWLLLYTNGEGRAEFEEAEPDEEPPISDDEGVWQFYVQIVLKEGDDYPTMIIR